MSSHYTSLTDLGPVALSHRDQIEEVKERIGIHHGYFDAWIYGFLENKKFDIEETVAKLHRRFAMEVSELATYELTDFMRASLRKGIIQEVGEDKLGRVIFYINTKRDFPEAKHREEQKRTFDMFVNYGTRLRKDNKRCQLIMLINQDGASMFSNVDMSFQADVALRISKFYPGGVDKMYICKMGRALAAMAKPIFKRLPAIVSDRIQIIDAADIKNGVLLDVVDDSVLPTDLGGKNNCDNQEHWNAYADRVEAYYSELKYAVNERGLTVKEWELEKLGIDPREANINEERASHKGGMPSTDAAAHLAKSMNSVRSFHGEASGPMFRQANSATQGSSMHAAPEEMRPLMTCLSDPDYVESPYGGHEPYEGANSEASWARIMAPFPRPLALFFLDELLRWRNQIEDQEVSERFKLLDSAVDGEHTAGGLKGLNVNDQKWYVGIPYPLRSLYRVVLTGVTVFNAIYTIAAVVFFATFTANLIVTIFYGFAVKASYFFPLNCLLVMVTVQGTSLCARAVDMLQAMYEGEVMPPFERLGSGLGTLVEVIYFFVVVAIQLVIFCIYAAKDNPLRGLQVSFTTGWFSVMLVVAFTHVFFFTGFVVSRRSTTNSLAALPFFLALNFGAQGEAADETYIVRTSSFVICGFPITVSMLLGIGFLISRIQSLFVCTVVASLVAAFVVNYYAEDLSSTLSGTFIRVTLWMLSMTWLYATFTFGFRNFAASWAVSVCVATVLHGVFVILAFFCLNRGGRSWLLRLSFIALILYLVGCWIASFPLVSWQVGVFCLAIMAHNVLNVVFAPRDLTNISSVFFVSAATLLLMMATVLLGCYGSTLQHRTPQSLPSVTPAPPLSSIELYHRYPVCTVSFGLDESFTAADLSLLTEVVMSYTPAAFNADFTEWFGTRNVTYNSIVRHFSSDGTAWEMHEFRTSPSANTTFYVLNNKYALSSIIATSTWVDSIALSPLSIFMPFNWANHFVYVWSFVGNMIDYEWQQLISEVATFLQQAEKTTGTQIIVTGAGVAGGLASIAAVESKTQAVVFSAPGLLHELKKFGVSFADYHSYVLAVGAYYGILDNIGGQDVTVKQKLTCDGSAQYCSSQRFISKELLRACNDQYGRQHVKMDDRR